MGSLELDTTERLHFHFPLSCIGEGNGNPLQCSCLENPGDGKPGGLPSMGSELNTTKATQKQQQQCARQAIWWEYGRQEHSVLPSPPSECCAAQEFPVSKNSPFLNSLSGGCP